MVWPLLALQLAAATATPPPPESAPAADSAHVVATLRRDATRFLMAWRDEWTDGFRAARGGRLRRSTIHCHSDGTFDGPRPPLVIPSASSRRSTCPTWYPDGEPAPHAEWAAMDRALREDRRARVDSARLRLLARLDSAAAAWPGDWWLAGQRVRFRLDRGDLEGAQRSASECAAADGSCAMLQVLVLTRGGRHAEADSVATAALAAMTAEDACRWGDIGPLLAKEDRSSYLGSTCEERAVLEERYWWLADPLHAIPGNARRAEHFARRALVDIRSSLTSGGDAIAELLLRYGPPDYVEWGGMLEDASHFGWLGFRDSSIHVTAEYLRPRVHVAPPWRVVNQPLSLTAVDLLEPGTRDGRVRPEDRLPIEFFRHPGGSLTTIDAQHAVFRRRRDLIVAVAGDMPSDLVEAARARRYTAVIASSSAPSDLPSLDRRSLAELPPAVALATTLPAGERIVGLEVLPDSGPGPMARTRFGIGRVLTLGADAASSVELSDLILFRPGSQQDPTPSDLESVVPRMHGSAALGDVSRLGVFWELYGVAPAETVHVALRITPTDRPGVMRRLGAALGIADRSDGDVVVRWTEPYPGRGGTAWMEGSTPVQARSVVLDVSGLQPGRYAMELVVTRPGGGEATVRRSMSVR